MESTAVSNNSKIPTSFVCPLTGQIMLDPVITCTGYSYERSAIEKWLKNNNTCPTTKVVLSNKNLLPNHTLKKFIEEFLTVGIDSVKRTYISSGSYDCIVKIHLIGDTGAGKKSLFTRYCDEFTQFHQGLNFKNRTLQIGHLVVKTQTWLYIETENMINMEAIRHVNVRGLVINLNTLSDKKMVNSFSRFVNKFYDNNTILFVFGTHSDLPREEISDIEFHARAKHYGLLSAIVSAKTGQGVDEAFIYAVYSSLLKNKSNNIRLPKIKEFNKNTDNKNQERLTFCNLM